MHSRRFDTVGFVCSVSVSRDAARPSEARGSGRPGALGSLADTGAVPRAGPTPGRGGPSPLRADQSEAAPARRPRTPLLAAPHTAPKPRHRRSCTFFHRFLRQLHESFPLFGFSVWYLIKIAEFLPAGTRRELDATATSHATLHVYVRCWSWDVLFFFYIT